MRRCEESVAKLDYANVHVTVSTVVTSIDEFV